jgi:ketosteroid isomerase-like protein
MNTSALTPEDVQALREITQIHINSSLNQDWRAWTATCSDDVLLLPPGAARVDGREATAKWLEGFPKILEFSGEPSVVQGNGTMAFTSGSAPAKLEVNGEVTEARFKWLAVFEKDEGGTWKMIANMFNDDA